MSPSHDKNYVVVVMYEDQKKPKLSFCRKGDQEWHDLECKDDECYDVAFCDETNMVFALGLGPFVEAWDLKERAPRKTMTILESHPRQLEEACEIFAHDLYTTHWHLAPLKGQIFFVVRYIGKCFANDGRTLVCPYQTIDFDVFRFDAERKNWIEVESLNEFALFVGGSESMMLSVEENVELEGNSIYFTDDSWDKIHENNLYGGHDMGIFKMEDGIVEPIMKKHKQKVKPPPFWISLPPIDR
ncbi:hypothetical protein CDL12_13672 [Handroanthus impetiginosus]|uniref:KIB1-4 beta-propeller domain-containing protein n=1 Tax=Handroanthus impetiginosus TaxID=429701 RepID=A0A2G9H884_9LAMI|nr:hypothetical protein CDL12_13672 [Handroanthus impetiginosus]